MMRGRGGAGNSDDGAPPALLSCDAPQDGQVDAPGKALEEAVEGVPQPDGRGELSHATGRRGGGGGLGECWGAHGLRAGDEGRRARGPHAAIDVADAAELVEDVREDEVCARGDGRGEEERERGGRAVRTRELGGDWHVLFGDGEGWGLLVVTTHCATTPSRTRARGGPRRGREERAGWEAWTKRCGGPPMESAIPPLPKTLPPSPPRGRGRRRAPRPRGQMEDPSLSARARCAPAPSAPPTDAASPTSTKWYARPSLFLSLARARALRRPGRHWE
jgi:hypothetical protein